MAIIGYGEADFHSMITKGHHFVDRTSFIATQESLGSRNLMFTRPRRFGKSLWISVLHHYYDAQFKDEFDFLFGKYYIGQNPTPNRNNYMVVRFQFSGIDVSSDEKAYIGFRSNIQQGFRQAMLCYSNYFLPEDIARIEASSSAEGMLQEFLYVHQLRKVPYKIYTLIDEYDHFANDLFTLDVDRFQNIVSRTGFVRKFYELIKNAMGEGRIDRNFMTGVAPLTVDAMTSGFNTVTHLALDLGFHELMGFKKAEVETIMQLVGVTDSLMPQVMADLTAWYDGYLFNTNTSERLYNSDMVMYFAGNYERWKKYPEPMLDVNIASDYTKVRKVFMTNSKEDTYIPLLKKLTNEGVILAKITNMFNFEKTFEEADIVSLLFYMGWLTIQEKEEGENYFIFKIPNMVIQELYYDYFVELSEQETKLNKTEEVDDKTLDKITDEARLQLKAYLQSDNAKRLDNLKAWLVILVGRKWPLIEEITA